MFEKMLGWIRAALAKLLRREGDTQSAAATDVMVSSEMRDGVSLWAQMYAGKAPWNTGEDTPSLELAATIAAEFARLVMLEAETRLTGSPRADWLNDQYQPFVEVLRNGQLEYACAKGGMVFKPYVSGDGIRVDCVQADRFYPLAFDGSRMTGAVFVARIIRNGVIYTRLEAHDYKDGSERITNVAYASKTDTRLGHEIELTEVPEWASLQPDTTIGGLKGPLFAYFHPALANHLDDDSPLGVSVYSRAVGLIRDADRQYGRLMWEYEGGELAIDAADDLFRPDGGIDKGHKRLYRQLHSPAGSDFYKVFAPALRDASLLNGWNAIARRIEFNCCLSYGTLSDVQDTEKTAEEIKASKQRSYSAVAATQKQLEAALNDLIDAMDVLATLYHLAPAGSIERSFTWDDSIIADRKTEFQERLQIQTACNTRPELLVAWYYGVSEEEAKGMINSGDVTESFWGGEA